MVISKTKKRNSTDADLNMMIEEEEDIEFGDISDDYYNSDDYKYDADSGNDSINETNNKFKKVKIF